MDASNSLSTEIMEVALGADGLRAWKIASPLCHALISQQGAQVLAFQATGKLPLLWRSEQALYVPGKAIRGGIPLCFPWFGPHPQDRDKPAHGFARLRPWTLLQAENKGDTVHLGFRLQSDVYTRAFWPHDFVATLNIALGRALALQLSVENTGSEDFELGFAFHSYFQVANIHRARVDGLEGSTFIDQLHPARARFRQEGPLRFSGETDRVYLHTPSQCFLVDEAGAQAVRISTHDCRSTVVWNPWQAKTARLADMRPDAWREMVCVESGNVEDDRVILPAGASKAFSLLLEGEA